MHERTEQALDAAWKMFQRRRYWEIIITWIIGVILGIAIGYWIF